MSIRWFQPKTLLATLGAVILPLLALYYLASMPGINSPFWVLVKVGIVILGVIGFALLLARLVEQMSAARVGRWLETEEGRAWLDELPDDEREAFQERFDVFR